MPSSACGGRHRDRQPEIDTRAERDRGAGTSQGGGPDGGGAAGAATGHQDRAGATAGGVRADLQLHRGLWSTTPTVYYPAVYAYPPGYVATASLLSFGAGMAVGAAVWGGCNWHSGDVNVNYNYSNTSNRNVSNIDRKPEQGGTTRNTGRASITATTQWPSNIDSPVPPTVAHVERPRIPAADVGANPARLDERRQTHTGIKWGRRKRRPGERQGPGRCEPATPREPVGQRQSTGQHKPPGGHKPGQRFRK